MLKLNRDTAGQKSAAIFEPILDALDEAARTPTSPEPNARTRKRARRIAYRQQISASIEHPGGGSVTLSVASRNLSPGGIGLLCNAFIHPGSMCTLTLVTADREQVAVQGRVAHCHLVRGRVHEIGVKFDEPIILGGFIAPESMPQAELMPAELQGCVLLLDDSPLELMLFKHCIQETKIKLTAVQQSTQAIAALKAERFDIFVCGHSLKGDAEDGISVVKQARAGGFIGPIIMMTAEAGDDRHPEARAAGASHVMAKPYKPNALLALLQRVHQDCGAMVTAELLVNTRADLSGVAPLQKVFHEKIGLHAEELQQALIASDISGLRRACQAVKAAASGMGYMNLAASVDGSLVSLKSRPIAALRPALLRIAAACRALGHVS